METKRKDVPMKIKSWLIGLLFLPMTMMAQNKDLTLQDLIPGGKNYFHFVPKNLSQLQWNGDSYLYAKGDTMKIVSMPKMKEGVAFTCTTLNEALIASGKKVIGRLPYFSYPYKGKTVLSFMSNKELLHYDYAANKIIASYNLNPNLANFDFCPENNCLAFTEGNNLKFVSADNKVTTVTSETAEGVV